MQCAIFCRRGLTNSVILVYISDQNIWKSVQIPQVFITNIIFDLCVSSQGVIYLSYK